MSSARVNFEESFEKKNAVTMTIAHRYIISKEQDNKENAAIQDSSLGQSYRLLHQKCFIGTFVVVCEVILKIVATSV